MTTNYLNGRFIENKTAEQRKLNSKLSNISKRAEIVVNLADITMESAISENNRLEVRPVSDSALIKGVLLDNGFDEVELSETVFLAVPSDLLVMPISQWVLDKYTVNTKELAEIKTYDKFNHEYKVIGFGFNNMEHDRGSKIVIGGKIGRQTYVAPYMLVKHLNEKNTLEFQEYEGFLLGLNENEKAVLKRSQKSHYYEAYYRTAAAKASEYENTYNAWAFRVLDEYYQSNKDFWNGESELEIKTFIESLTELLENIDWRKSKNTISQLVLREIDEDLRSLIDFYNGEAVVEAINELELSKSKFEAVRASIVKLAEYYLANESDEDNAFSVDEKLEDYDSNQGTDYSQSRGYSKAYLERPIVEEAIARGVITEYINSQHYSRSFECYAMELELEAIRESSVAHEKELESRFKEKAKEQAYWDRMERELGVRGLTAFTPASNFKINEYKEVL